MKVKFTKLAALLLAGAALFATGCTDYEVDIQKVDKKVDDLTSGKVASLEKQVAGLEATVATLETAANHKADIDKLTTDIANLKKTLEDDYKAKIQEAVNTLNGTINTLTTQMNTELGKKLDKTEFEAAKTQMEAALTDLNTRVKAIEDADFQKQINDLTAAMQNALVQITTALNNLDNKKADKEQVAKDIAAAKSELETKIADLETALRGEIKKLDDRLKLAEAAITDIKENLIPGLQAQIDNINNVVIPKINQDIAALQSGKLDKSEFNEYKEATKKTIEDMDKALRALIDTKVDKTVYDAKMKELDEQISKVIAKFDDYVLTETFEAFVKIAATKKELQDVKSALEGRLNALETLTAGFPEGTTIKAYVDGKISDLQGQLDKLTNAEGTGRIDVLEKNAAKLREDVDGILDLVAFAEGDLQGYIDDAAAKALADAMAYTDDQIAALREEMYFYLNDLYYMVFTGLERIQSVVFVPTHDDLKMNMNISVISQSAVNETGQTEQVFYYYGQPTEVTYKITPAEYAGWLANYIDYGLDKEWAQLFKEYYGLTLPAVYFDVKPLAVRPDMEAPEVGEEDETPELAILGCTKYDNETGEITLMVEPYGIASPDFLANANEPSYTLPLTDSFGNIITAGGSDVTGVNMLGILEYLFGMEPSTIPVWNMMDYVDYALRTSFAASLTVYTPDVDNTDLYDYWYYAEEGTPGDIYGYDYYMFHNEVASPYTVLYPIQSNFEILPDAYKPDLDEEGNPKTDDEGYTMLVKAMPDHQTLPYSATRENPVGEKPDQDPKGYRVVLDQAVPAVSFNGSRPMLLEEAAEKYDLYYPIFVIEPVEFSFDKGTAEDVDPENFVVTDVDGEYQEFYDSYEDYEAGNVAFEGYDIPVDAYAMVEMNPEKNAAVRRGAIGNVITGTYTFTSMLGSFNAEGDVTITLPQGSAEVSAEIEWLYSADAETDHENAYGDGADYSRAGVELTIVTPVDEALAITLDDFDGVVPTITITDEEGEEVDYITIDNITIDGDKVTVDVAGFLWDQTYNVVANFELETAYIEVKGVLTTKDRNREKITITLPQYKVVLNGDDYNENNDTYTSENYEFQEDLFEAFVAQEIINTDPEALDFEDADAFVPGEGQLTPDPDDADAAFMAIYDDYAVFEEVSSADLHTIWENGDDLVRNVTTYIGQEVEIIWNVTVDLPVYDFLHLSYYTFNTKDENKPFIQKYDFDANDGTIEWWTQVYPSYFTGTENAQGEKVSFRKALADYDVADIDLAELAFNVVDENDEPLEEEDIEEAHLIVKFKYTDETLGDKELPKVDQVDPDYLLYQSLWVDNTVFYYRTNDDAYKFMPAYGYIAVLSGDTEFKLETRFDKDRAAVKYPDVTLNYSKYAMVRWTPFKEAVATGYTIVLDENKIYRVPLFKGMELQDNRPQGLSYYVIKDGEWVVGNVTDFDVEAGTTVPEDGNGYMVEIPANVAYHIETSFAYDDLELPVELRKLLSVKYSADGVTFVDEEEEGMTPYIVFDYTSEVQFRGTVEIPVAVTLDNPWQKQLVFEYSIFIKGTQE